MSISMVWDPQPVKPGYTVRTRAGVGRGGNLSQAGNNEAKNSVSALDDMNGNVLKTRVFSLCRFKHDYTGIFVVSA